MEEQAILSRARDARSLRSVGLASLVMVALLGGFASAALGQEATGTLTGTITDPQNAAMAGVNVVVHNSDTGVDQRPVTTNESGIYQIPLLQPGTYDVTASQTGFATLQRKGVLLQVGQTVRIDIAMTVASQQSLVTVTTEVPILETEKTEQSQNVSEALVSNLPVSSRRWEQFALLTPGVNYDGSAGAISVHGINSLYNNNSVDGANNNSSYNATTRGGENDGYLYSSDSIREFQVATSGFSAELGQAAGGAVNAVTKSGTGQFHGDLFYNGRSNAFNALDPVAKFNAASAPVGTSAATPVVSVHQQDQWGGSLGGPIVRDKLFFFVTDDGYRKVDPLTVTTVQLSPSINALTCPTLTAAGIAASAAVPNAAQCQAAKDYIFAHYIGVYPRHLRQDVELVKLDYQLNQSNHLNVVTNIRDYDQSSPESLQNGNAAAYLQDRFVIGNWNLVIGNNKVNELRYQWGLDEDFNGKNRLDAAPQTSLSNAFTYGNAAGTSWHNEFRNQISDNFSLTRGTHTIKFGVDVNFIRDYLREAVNSIGPYTYSGVALGSNVSCAAPVGSASSTQTVNTEFCDWLVDLFGSNIQDGKTGQHWTTYTEFVDNIDKVAPDTFLFDLRSVDAAGFVQDTWKVRSNFTVNYGLRYDFQSIPQPQHTVAAVFGQAADLPILDYYTTHFPSETDAIQPRLGVAWNFTKNTVVRVGGGVFFAKTDGHVTKNVNSGASETTSNCATPVVTTGTNPTCPINLTFPNQYFNQDDVGAQSITFPGLPANQEPVPVVAQGLPGLTVPNPNFGIRGADPASKRPRAYEFEAAVERQLPWNMNVSVSYIFTRGAHLPHGKDANLAGNFDPAYCSSNVASSCNGLTVTKTYDVVNAAGATQLTSTVPLFFRRVDGRTGVIPATYSDVNSLYNGMVVTLRKPMAHGVEVLANYTLSKATDDGQGSSNSGGETQIGAFALNPFDVHGEQGPSATDSRNRFTTSVVWAPTFAQNAKNKFVRVFAGGWNLSGTVIAQNGTHYSALETSSASPTLTGAQGIAGFNSAGVATVFTYTGLDGGMTGASLTSPGARAANRISWLPNNSFELPNLYNVDLRLTKSIAIKERYHIEIRGEAFNLFNGTLVQAVSKNAYNYGAPTASTAAAPTPSCWNGTITSGPGPAAGTQAHTNTCMVPVSTFQQLATTTGNLLGARQLQAGVRFEF
jgi:hypothetical protein